MSEPGRELLVPLTGQVVSLDSEDVTLASLVDELRAAKGQINDAIRVASNELIARMTRSAKWTRHLPGYTITAPASNVTVEYAAESLYWALQELVDHGTITRDALEAAVEQVVDYKAKAGGLKALAKVSDEIAELIAAHSREVEKPRNVSVKRAA